MTESSLPRISIVTPSYNQAAFVEWTVRSVLDQRYPNLEYIFMDGGSTDGTLEKIEKYRHNFAHFRSQSDGGQAAAIASGFEIASGDILGFLNSDDLLLPGALAFVADFFRRNPDVDFVYGHRCIVDDSNVVLGHWILPAHCSFLMRRWDLIPQETCFWRRRLFEAHGNVDSSYRFAMDYDLFVRYMRTGRLKRVNRFLAAFRVHPAAKTSVQLDTIGEAEIKKVRARYRLIMPPLIGRLYSLFVQAYSAFWLRKRRAIPGLPPGSGYDIATVWSIWPGFE